MNFDYVMPSERSQSQKITYYMTSFIRKSRIRNLQREKID